MVDQNRKVLFCSCGAECLVLEKFTEHSEHRSNCIGERDELFVSLFQYAHYARPHSLWRRIKYALHILWTGEPYYDEVILEAEKVRELKKWLNKEFNDNGVGYNEK
jgi:hypothetical protein